MLTHVFLTPAPCAFPPDGNQVSGVPKALGVQIPDLALAICGLLSLLREASEAPGAQNLRRGHALCLTCLTLARPRASVSLPVNRGYKLHLPYKGLCVCMCLHPRED